MSIQESSVPNPSAVVLIGLLDAGTAERRLPRLWAKECRALAVDAADGGGPDTGRALAGQLAGHWVRIADRPLCRAMFAALGDGPEQVLALLDGPGLPEPFHPDVLAAGAATARACLAVPAAR